MESMELLELCIRWESRSPRCEVSAFWVVDGRFLSSWENQKGGGGGDSKKNLEKHDLTGMCLLGNVFCV